MPAWNEIPGCRPSAAADMYINWASHSSNDMLTHDTYGGAVLNLEVSPVPDETAHQGHICRRL
jgi:hypothetical protein